MKNLILIFLIIIFSVSSVYADAENRIKKIDVMKKHNPDKRFFCCKRKPIVLDRQRKLDRQRDDVNIYFASGNIALAAIVYLTPKEIWQHIFIRVRSHNSKHNYIIGVQIKF